MVVDDDLRDEVPRKNEGGYEQQSTQEDSLRAREAIRLFLTFQAKTGMWNRLQTTVLDLLATGFAHSEVLFVEAAQRLLDLQEAAPFCGGDLEIFLPLDCVGAQIRDVDRVGGEVS